MFLALGRMDIFRGGEIRGIYTVTLWTIITLLTSDEEAGAFNGEMRNPKKNKHHKVKLFIFPITQKCVHSLGHIPMQIQIK